MIPSRTKHESFDSFGSHAHLFQSIIYETSLPIFFMQWACPLPSFFIQFIFNIYFYRKRSPIQDKNIRRILLTNEKLIIVSKVVSFFLEIQRILIILYVGYQFCIIKKDSKNFIDMSVLYRKKYNNSFWKFYSFFYLVYI